MAYFYSLILQEKQQETEAGGIRGGPEALATAVGSDQELGSSAWTRNLGQMWPLGFQLDSPELEHNWLIECSTSEISLVKKGESM